MVKQISLDLGKAEIGKAEIQAVNVFARHETFHPRFGWLKKGFDRAAQDPKVFLHDDAPIRLGVGKNMVRSIRYWEQAFKLLQDDEPTEFGQRLLSDTGWDPFLEDTASLWLLHWQLLKLPCYATAWYYTFNLFRPVEFTEQDLLIALENYYQEQQGLRIASSSFQKDVRCLLKMYVEQQSKSGFTEDSIDCPFTELGLLHTAGDARIYTFRVGAKSNLPPAIVVAACLEFAAQDRQGQGTIAVSRLLYEAGSPGLAFKLSESALCDAIERISQRHDEVTLSDTAGLIQFSFTENPLILAEQILQDYYRGR
ncbi:DUF4007 family protein [Leptolyngbya ohadii]|uniref:DUF4007 family protein n=1 Tax=Leptolyngbya ohadii TaxID=1962290 RepID=UPI000B5A0728|nr:DUF4007 family protein [Leptolyngbya ohadii]